MNKIGLNAFQLKWIAIITMAVDHTGSILFPEQLVFRYIGRIAFPIFCFLLVEGFFYTSNVKKYLIRLAIFACVSEVPFDLALFGAPVSMEAQNVFVTLFLGVLMLYFIKESDTLSLKLLVAAAIMILAEVLHSDYGMKGILLIGGFHILRERKIWNLCYGVLWNFFGGGYWKIQGFGSLAMIPIAFYNEKKGPGMKYLFYVFYPAHLLILYLIRIYVFL